MPRLTKKKATEILSNLPAAFEKIQALRLIDQGLGVMSVSQVEVAKHFNFSNNAIKRLEERNNEFNTKSKDGRYSNECGCFGAHMHAEIWLASYKAGFSQKHINLSKKHDSMIYLRWRFENGCDMLSDLLLKFPKYRKWQEDHGFPAKPGKPSKLGHAHVWGETGLAVFLHKECKAPKQPFGANRWRGKKPSQILTNLNNWLGIETVAYT